MGRFVRFPGIILQSCNFPMGCKIFPGNLTILQFYKPPHWMGCKIITGNLTTLQSYKPPHWMGCKIIPGNLTILQTPPWDVRLQSYNLTDCKQTILQPGCRHRCLEIPWLSEMLVGSPRGRLDLRTQLLDRVLQEFLCLGLGGLRPDFPLPPLLLSKPLLVFRDAPGRYAHG